MGQNTNQRIRLAVGAGHSVGGDLHGKTTRIQEHLRVAWKT